MRKYTIEFFGTFFLLLISALSENPIAIGLGLAALIYTGAHISGAHYNPAVSLAMFIRGEINRKDLLFYIVFQILGAIFGSLAYFLITNGFFEIEPNSSTTRNQFLIAEFIFTFLLVITILFVATHPKIKKNNYYGAVIGLVVVASQYSIGDISSSVLNPAISIGPSLFNIADSGSINMSLAFSPYYIAITLIASVFSAYIYNFYLKED
jgi:glycerol uptake facilitator-like aquaporin